MVVAGQLLRGAAAGVSRAGRGQAGASAAGRVADMAANLVSPLFFLFFLFCENKNHCRPVVERTALSLSTLYYRIKIRQLKPVLNL